MLLLYDARRAFGKKWIVVGMISMMAVAVLTNLDVIVETVRVNMAPENGFAVSLMIKGLTSTSMLFLLPVLCTLPYASAFVDEYKSGVIRFSLTRSERKKYLISKASAAVLSGGVMLLVGALAVALLFAVLFLRLEESGESVQPLAESLMPLFQLIVRYFLLGGLWSLTGMVISTVTNSRHMAWTGPFMVEYLLIILCERYWKSCDILYPKDWIAPEQQWPMDNWSICLWLCALILTEAWMFVYSAVRRLKDVL